MKRFALAQGRHRGRRLKGTESGTSPSTTASAATTSTSTSSAPPTAGEKAASAKTVAKDAEGSEQKADAVAETASSAVVPEVNPLREAAKKSTEKPTGIFSSVMASMMKNDVRAAYECSLLPPEQQKEFLSHVRDIEKGDREAELERLKEKSKSDLEIAKLKAKAAIDEIQQRRASEEESEQSHHARQIELLEKQSCSDVAMVTSKFKFQKWKSVAEREKRLRLKAEEVAQRKEHALLLSRLQAEHEAKKQDNAEALRIEAIRHAQSLELEAAKASAAKERLSENTAAIQMGPNAVIESVREDERAREEKQREERDTQRRHEWELHEVRLKEAEQRALEASRLSTATTRSEMIWRAAQIVLASFAIFGAYDWEMKKLADRQASRDHEAATRREAEEAESARKQKEVDAEAARIEAEKRAAEDLTNLQHSADVELELLKKNLLDLEIERARAEKDLTEASEKGHVAEAEKKRVELELTEAQTRGRRLAGEHGEKFIATVIVGGIVAAICKFRSAQ